MPGVQPMEQLFGLKGERVISEFLCAKKRRRGGQLLYHGRLYVSQNYVCWHARTIVGATKDVVVPFGELVRLHKSRHAMINPAIHMLTRQKRYLFTSFFPFTMRDHAFTIIEAQWALYNAAVVLQRRTRELLVAKGRLPATALLSRKLIFKPIPSTTLVGKSISEELIDLGDDDSSNGQPASAAGTADIGDVLDLDILSDLQAGVQGMHEEPLKHVLKTFELPVSVKQAFALLFSDGSDFTSGVLLPNQVRAAARRRSSAAAQACSRTRAHRTRAHPRGRCGGAGHAPHRRARPARLPRASPAGGVQGECGQVAALDERGGHQPGREQRRRGHERGQAVRRAHARGELRAEDRQPALADQAGARLLGAALRLAALGRVPSRDLLGGEGRALLRRVGHPQQVARPPARWARAGGAGQSACARAAGTPRPLTPRPPSALPPAPAGDLGMESPMCQVTVSIEAKFFKKLLWAAKMESETLAQAAKDYGLLVPKVIAYVQADEVPALPPTARTPSAARSGETELESLRRRLAEAEELLRTGAAVRVPNGWGSGWLKGIGSGKKGGGAAELEFVVRAELDEHKGTWAWHTAAPSAAEGTAPAPSAKLAQVAVRPANLASPSA